MNIPLLEAATAQLAALKDQPPIPMEITADAAMMFISQLQLALRHPENTGPGSRHARAFIAGLRSRIAAPGDPLDQLIGWALTSALTLMKVKAMKAKMMKVKMMKVKMMKKKAMNDGKQKKRPLPQLRQRPFSFFFLSSPTVQTHGTRSRPRCGSSRQSAAARAGGAAPRGWSAR